VFEAVRISQRDSFWFGVSLVLLGTLVAVVGYSRSSHSFAETSGTITQASLASGQYGPGPRVLSYKYRVDDAEYSGQESLRYISRQDEALQVGRTIRVFYERAHPLVSYPVAPPNPVSWLAGGVFLIVFGATATIWGWRR
jgi:hypothetical protein